MVVVASLTNLKPEPVEIMVEEALRRPVTLRLFTNVLEAVETRPKLNRPKASMVKRSVPAAFSRFKKLPVKPVVLDALIRLPEVEVALMDSK